MLKKIVAIVGRPNVGKSTLFNRLCRKRKAIVDPEAGITRDRKYEEIIWNEHAFVIVDTGGIIPYSDDTIDKQVKFQAELSIEEADFILFIVDAHTGTTDIDIEIARTLAPHHEKVMLVANKVDNEKFALDLYDFLQLGFDDPFPISAVHGRNTGNFMDEMIKRLKPSKIEEEQKKTDEETIHVAIVGKPNVGKSSIVNRLVGENTVIVSEIPGTTRDSIDTTLNYFNKKLVLIDTAGLRKKTRIKQGVEYFSSMRTIESINRADIVLLILDATSEVSMQDKRIASYAHRNYKDMIVVFNKWDLVEKDSKTVNKFTKEFARELPFLVHAPIVFSSALTGQRVRKLLETILEVMSNSNQRIPTSKLNQFLKSTIAKYPPSHPTGKHIKFYYCTQVMVHPPTIVFFCNNAKLVSEQYRRYLHNRLRDEFDFSGAAIRMFVRGRDHISERDRKEMIELGLWQKD